MLGLEVLTAVTVKMAVFWVVQPGVSTDWCEFTDVSEVCTASLIALMIEAVQTSETLVN
jgi:hypothetical protein